MTIINHPPESFERLRPIDHADRDRLLSDLDNTFFVEAGAGTGKTTALVGRIVAMVAAGRLDLEQLAAITFTEAAAAELRSRIRRDLEGAAANLCRPDIERQRCRKATEQVDLASIQTIHAFAATLLRTFPIEAELPPGFEVWDAVKADLKFDERFRAWLWDEVPSARSDDRARREDIRRALLLGMTFDHLRDLAEALQEQDDLLNQTTAGALESLPDAVGVARRLGREILGLEELFRHSSVGEGDPLIREFRRHELEVVRLAASVDENDALVALQAVGKFDTHKGRQSDWTKDSTGQNAAKTIKASYKAVSDEIAETVAAHRRATLRAVLGHLRDFTLAFENERRQLGVATFHDLLRWASRLLRDNLDVRQQARRRFSRIFVDEFQDTDPLQAEIVWFLAGDDPTSRVATWRDIALEPGKLFVVGDPKQSIYRFRRADIGLYSRIYSSVPPDGRARLVENFRSVGPVLDWVNFQFTADMVGPPGVQAPYVSLHGPSVDGQVGGVHLFGGLVEEGAGLAWELEATAVARFARTAVADGWLVRDEDDVIRAAGYSDVCILLKTRTNVRNLEDAFEKEGVPYRMESGSLVLDTPEVRDLLACLRAIDDPSDQVALVAALRSPAYGCSDVDLLDWVDRGGKLDYQQPHDGLDGAVAVALDSLRAFHLARVDRSVAATVETFLRERMLVVGVFDRARPREAWRRLRYVVSQARTLAAAGRDTLRALMDWLENLQRARVRDVESPLPEADEDAVRVMTIHGAKGLEFPITVITGAGSAGGGGTRGVQTLSDRETGGLEVKVGPFESAGYVDARRREDLLDEAEEIRLFYVAATRARDHLVLSLYHGKRGTGSAAARFLKGVNAPDCPRCSHLSLDALAPPVIGGRRESTIDGLTPLEHEAAEDRWVSERAVAIARATRSPSVTASELVRRAAGVSLTNVPHDLALASEPWTTGPSLDPASPDIDRVVDLFLDDDDGERSGLDPEAPPADPAVDTAVSIGRAVHQALAESGPLQSPLLGRIVQRAAVENNLPSRYVERVRDLVLAALRGPTIVAARSRPHWCEVSLGIHLDDTILSGRIDLVVENLDGSLGIVDYKTDRVEADAVAHHARTYRVQAGAYALGLTAITHKPVSSVTLIFAALNGAEVRWDDIDALVAEARVMLG